MKDMKTYMRERRDIRRNLAYLRLGSCCKVCGSTSNLEFDHIDPSTKEFNISSAKALDGPLERLFSEVDKCQLLCKKHHVEKTNKENSQRVPHNKIFNPVHGTAVMYARKCRCDICRKWKRLYRLKKMDSLGVLVES